MTIAFATADAFRDLDDDLPLLLDAAERRGIAAELVSWDDPAADWSSYESVIVRSCWDYINRRDEFLTWTASVPRLHNSHQVISWNTDKVYLRQLAAAGVPSSRHAGTSHPATTSASTTSGSSSRPSRPDRVTPPGGPRATTSMHTPPTWWQQAAPR